MRQFKKGDKYHFFYDSSCQAKNIHDLDIDFIIPDEISNDVLICNYEHGRLEVPTYSAYHSKEEAINQLYLLIDRLKSELEDE
jgi:hypothetical protein